MPENKGGFYYVRFCDLVYFGAVTVIHTFMADIIQMPLISNMVCYNLRYKGRMIFPRVAILPNYFHIDRWYCSGEKFDILFGFGRVKCYRNIDFF